jgi:uncharacterized protein YciI
MSQPGFTTVYMVFLHKGPNYPTRVTPESERLQEAHLAYLRSLRQSGRLIIVGPVQDNGDLRGMGVYRVDSLEEARSLAEADPAVKAGEFTVEVHPWMVEQATLVENRQLG